MMTVSDLEKPRVGRWRPTLRRPRWLMIRAPFEAISTNPRHPTSHSLNSVGPRSGRGVIDLCTACGCSVALGRKAISEPEVCVNEPPARQRGIQLNPEFADINVDGTVARPHLSSPHQREQVLARDDVIGAPSELRQQPQFPDRQHQHEPIRARQMLVGHDLQRPDGEQLGTRFRGVRHETMVVAHSGDRVIDR
jgi:hypothetical protein